MQKNFKNIEYKGRCLCGETSFVAKSEIINPHLCSCKMCQKSSGALTVAWLEFSLKKFIWSGIEPNLYQSSEKTQRCFCNKCGCLLGAINEGHDNIAITIASLENPNLAIPENQHSYKESAPDWWNVKINK
jgi:hypothetical protein